MVNDATGYIWRYFLKYKSNLTKNVLCLIKELKSSNVSVKIVKYVWCDNSWEIIAIEMVHKQEELGIEFEYIALSTSAKQWLSMGKYGQH